MAGKPYKPHPGSYAEQTINFLLGKGPDTAVTSSYLGKLLGTASSNIHTLLKTSVSYGFLVTHEGDDGVRMYSLGPEALGEACALSGTPTPEELDKFELVQQHIVSASNRPTPATSGVPSVFHLAGVLPMTVLTDADIVKDVKGADLVKLKTPKPPVAAPAATSVPGLRCGLFNNGDLVIESASGELTLNRDEVRDLIAYLDKISTALETNP